MFAYQAPIDSACVGDVAFKDQTQVTADHGSNGKQPAAGGVVYCFKLPDTIFLMTVTAIFDENIGRIAVPEGFGG